jgi:hypothetical protein
MTPTDTLTTSRILDLMIKGHPDLCDQILDTPGFARLFNDLCQKANLADAHVVAAPDQQLLGLLEAADRACHAAKHYDGHITRVEFKVLGDVAASIREALAAKYTPAAPECNCGYCQACHAKWQAAQETQR